MNIIDTQEHEPYGRASFREEQESSDPNSWPIELLHLPLEGFNQFTPINPRVEEEDLHTIDTAVRDLWTHEIE